MLLMFAIIVLRVIYKNYNIDKVTIKTSCVKQQKTSFSEYKCTKHGRFEIERKIISLAKSRANDARDDIVRLMVELYKLGDTSTFLEKNPFIHDAIFTITD